MCGINGVIDFAKRCEKEELQSMTESIYHRGPDSGGTEWFETEQCTVGLGHRRLSILDLSDAGHQPMYKHGNWISYNGEIYNYRDIQKRLIERGYQFKSNSDTEVLLSAYQEWGIQCLQQLEGMFAFAIYDNEEGILFLARDRAGMKPLYYYYYNDLFLFASELKALHKINGFQKEICPKGLSAFFQNGYIPSPLSIFKHTNKLQQGEYCVLHIRSKDLHCKNYWTINQKLTKEAKAVDLIDAIDHTEELLTNSCISHMISDVPVGMFLSGGYDSSTVAAMIQKYSVTTLKTFTIGFDDSKYNEAPHAKKVAEYLQTDHTELTCRLDEAKKIIPDLAEIYDEPFSDYSAIPTYLLSELTREHVKVVISADGGDELFVGYRRFLNSIKLAKVINRTPKSISNVSAKILKAINRESFGENYVKRKLSHSLRDGNISSIPIYQNQKLLSEDIQDLLLNADIPDYDHYHTLGDMNDIFRIEYQQYLQDEILVKMDRASMAVGLEAREPLLNHKVVEWAINLPLSIKQKDGQLKFILKEIAHKYVPKELLDRPKQGFNIPIMKWIREDMNWLIEDLLNLDKIRKQGIFNSLTIMLIVREFNKGENSFYDKIIWQLIVFQMWYRKWMT